MSRLLPSILASEPISVDCVAVKLPTGTFNEAAVKLPEVSKGAAASRGVGAFGIRAWAAPAPLDTVIVSKYLSQLVARKAMPPDVMLLSVPWTVLSRVVPSLAKSRPVMLPPLAQAMLSKYHCPA